MILIIAGKLKFEEHLSVAASVKYFLISLTKVFFSFSKLLQQSNHLQVFFSQNMKCKIIAPVMPSFLKMIGA